MHRVVSSRPCVRPPGPRVALATPCWEAGPASPFLFARLAHISTARGLGTYFVFGALGCHWRAQGAP